MKSPRSLIVLAALPILVPGAIAFAQDDAATAITTRLTFGLTADEATPPPPVTTPPPPTETATDDDATASSDWWCDFDLALWLPGISGTVGTHGASASVNASFDQILTNSDSLVGLTGQFAFGKGKVGGFVGAFYSKIGSEGTTPGGTANLITEMGIADFGVSYEVGRWAMDWTASEGTPARDLVLTGRVFGRYTYVDVDATFPILGARSQSEGWVDPMIGGSLLFPFAPHWSAVLGGDIGGFGVNSDLAWGARAAVSFDFHIGRFPSSVQLGYMAVGDDYSTGSGTSQFVWDTILHGIVVDFQMTF